jgi:DNA-binding response OmpR family regulator
VDLLIAHVSETSRRRLAETLADEGVGLVEAARGDVVFDVLTTAGAPRLALIDWDLPVCDGPELCRLIRACRGAGMPYIILLARGDQSIAKGLDAGADDCIHTPADADELRARINVGRRFAELPWERVTPAAGNDAQPSAECDPRAAPVLDAQRSPDDEGPDGDDAALCGGKFELASLLVAS